MKSNNYFKQVVGFLFSLLAGAVGFDSEPEMVASFGSVLLAVYAGTALFKLAVNHSTLTQVVSWLLGLLISIAAWYLQLGMFAEMTWYFALITGFIISLAANGIKDAEWLESFWKLIKDLFK
jgi:hypothetical protein